MSYVNRHTCTLRSCVASGTYGNRAISYARRPQYAEDAKELDQHAVTPLTRLGENPLFVHA